jgi:hypothetical protein
VTQTKYRRPDRRTPREWKPFLDGVWRQAPDGIAYGVSLHLDPKCYGHLGGGTGRRVRHLAFMDRQGVLVFARRRQDAPVVHLGGRLTLLLRPNEKLRTGAEPGELSLWLGTPGLGPGTFAITWYDLVPADANPVVEVRFPAREGGSAPPTRRFALGRC